VPASSLLGYFLGQIQFVADNIEPIILGIIGLSVPADRHRGAARRRQHRSGRRRRRARPHRRHPAGLAANRTAAPYVLVLEGGGVDASFEAFVAARSRHLLHAAHLLTGDRHRAEDLLQTALTRAYLRWDRIDRRPGGLRAADDGQRAHRLVAQKPWREQATDLVPDVAVPDVSASYEQRDAVLAALATLSGRQRASSCCATTRG
jgi:hypothetical protein